MNSHDDIRALLPWYANGTLEPAERERVESHVDACADCAAELADHRRQREAATTSPEPHTEHVSSRLLVQFVEARDTLDAESVAFVEATVARCGVCREALDRLEEVERSLALADRDAAAAPVERDRGGLRAWFEAFVGTVLHPVPAVAYLLIAAVAVPLAWRASGVDVPTASPFPPVVELDGARASRSEGAEANAFDVGDAPVSLRLAVELAPGEIAAIGAFEIALVRDGVDVTVERRAAADFESRDDGAVLWVALDPRSLDRGVAYVLEVRAVRPGDPIDGQALFRRSVLRGVDDAR